MPNFTLRTDTGGNQITIDPERYSRDPENVGYTAQSISGRRIRTQKAIHKTLDMAWVYGDATQYDNLKGLLYNKELLFLDDSDVAPLIETERVYLTATYLCIAAGGE